MHTWKYPICTNSVIIQIIPAIFVSILLEFYNIDTICQIISGIGHKTEYAFNNTVIMLDAETNMETTLITTISYIK